MVLYASSKGSTSSRNKMQRTYIISQIQTELLIAFLFLVRHRLYFFFPFPTTVTQMTATEKTGLKWSVALFFRPYCTHLHSVMLDNTIIHRKPPASTMLPLMLHQFLLKQKEIHKKPRRKPKIFSALHHWTGNATKCFAGPCTIICTKSWFTSLIQTPEEIIKRAQKTWQQRMSKRCWETEKCWIKAQGQNKRPWIWEKKIGM